MKRFWAKVNKETENGCWEWVGCTSEFGYGLIGINKVPHRAHRVSWEIHNGLIPDGLCVLHKCDNPPCCNPDHLFLGTRKDNMQDMRAKGRDNNSGNLPIKLGERHHRTFLTESQVLEIRRLNKTMTQRKIAELFNIKFQLVNELVNRKTWRHI